jgi:CDP-diacylglycerol--glycerol-3-phosphate 3-phosphatidyltransferase
MRNLPNILTALRLAAAPALVLILALFPGTAGGWAAFLLFVVAAATDWLDGKLARAWNAQSAFGKMLDPIADKAMTLTALVVIVGLYGTEGLRSALALPAAAIILRETLVAGLREHLGGGPTLAVTGAAKWKTAAQLVALSLLLLAAPLADWSDRYGSWVYLWGVGLLWVAAILTLWTGWGYFWKALAEMRAREGARA